MKNKLILLIASGLGLGYAPLIPGTFGTLLGVLIYYFLGKLQWWLVILITILIFLIAVWSSHQAEKIMFTRDPQVVTIDEVAGYLVTMLSFPNNWKWLLAGFVLFRVFDIIKPWPASYFDNVSRRGFAVVMDDIVAGIYANICLQIVRVIVK
jgi:phosphatidylglycerophosphatase A